MKKIHLAPPCLIACLIAGLHAGSWADPMRPLILPAAASSASSSSTAALDRASQQARQTPAVREPERLVAIRQDGASRWQALFGERWVGVGDKLERYTVGAIDANTVQLTEGRQKRTLNLLPPLMRPGPAVAAAPQPLVQAQADATRTHRASGLPTP
jgi:hypothetical protein